MQKTLIVLVVGLLAVGCLTPEEKQKRLRDSVAGEYEETDFHAGGHKFVFLENGTAEGYVNGKKQRYKYKWSIVDGEIHVAWGRLVEVYRINTDKSITIIVSISDGKHQERTKEKQFTYKRIK